MGDFKYSLRTRIAVTSILMPAILVTVFLYIFFRHCKWQIVDSSVANARTICLCADSVYDEIESRWEMGLFTQELLQKWYRHGDVDKMRASSPLLTAWKTAAGNGYKFKVIEKHQGDSSNKLDRFETGGLEKLQADKLKEYYETTDSFNELRYLRPVKYSKSCSDCHSNPADSQRLWVGNWAVDDEIEQAGNCKAGQAFGAFEVTIPLADAKKQLAGSLIFAGIILVTGLTIYAFLFFAIAAILTGCGRNKAAPTKTFYGDTFDIGAALENKPEESIEPEKCKL